MIGCVFMIMLVPLPPWLLLNDIEEAKVYNNNNCYFPTATFLLPLPATASDVTTAAATATATATDTTTATATAPAPAPAPSAAAATATSTMTITTTTAATTTSATTMRRWRPSTTRAAFACLFYLAEAMPETSKICEPGHNSKPSTVSLNPKPLNPKP